MLGIDATETSLPSTKSARLGLIAFEAATTAGQLRRALENMRALPGMQSTPWVHGEGLRIVADEQRELSRLSGLDRETGLANLRRMNRWIRGTQGEPDACAPGISLLRLHFPDITPLRVIVRAAHLCLATLRPRDVIARLGHRRLGALLVGISPTDAAAVTARLRVALNASDLCGADSGFVLRLISRDL